MKDNNLLLLVPSLSSGGQERVVVRTASILKNDKNVTVAVFNGQHTVYDTDTTVVDLQIPPAKNKFQQVLNVFKRVRAVKKLKKELDIGCTISFGDSANMVNAMARQKDRVVLSVRGYTSVPQKTIGKLLWSYFYRKADLVTCVAKQLERELVKICHLKKENVCTVYNPYDFNEIFAASQEEAIVRIEEPVVVSVGRLVDVKGFHHLIRAVNYASERLPGLNLILIGEGPIEKELRQEAKDLGVKVKFLGFQKNPFAIVSKCSCFVLSSQHEGFPNAMLEAMVCGTPAIAVDCMTGPREILDFDNEEMLEQPVKTEYGVLCPAFRTTREVEEKQERALADAIVQVLHNPRVQVEFCAKAQVRARMFSFETYRKRLLDVVFHEKGE